MKQMTQKEYIDLIKEKQDNARTAYEQTFQMQPSYETKVREITNKAYIDCYQDLICNLSSVKIVPEHNDELDALQHAVNGLTYLPKEQQNLLKVFFGQTIKVHTKSRIVGSTTPFESMGKIVSDSGKYINLKEENGGNVIIDKEDIKNIETMSAPEQEDIKNSVDGKQEIRNDRVREFKEEDGDITYIDGKAIKVIQVDKEDDGYITLGLEKGGYFCFSKNEFDYNDVVAWWKYWKQN